MDTLRHTNDNEKDYKLYNEKHGANYILLRKYKCEIDNYKANLAELSAENAKLKRYNNKANDDITRLISRLKIEQEKQQQLSRDLEALREELKIHRINQII